MFRLLSTMESLFKKKRFNKRTRKSTKKDRKYQKETFDENVQQYSIVGSVIFFRKLGKGSTFSLRNVVTLTSFEMNFMVFSCMILYSYFMQKQSVNKLKLSKQYYYRDISPSRSQVKWEFSLGRNSYYNELFDEIDFASGPKFDSLHINR